MKILNAFLCTLIILFGGYSCSQPAATRILSTVSELPAPAISPQAVNPLRFEHSFSALPLEVLKERIGRIQYLADPADELAADRLTISSKNLEQLTQEQALEDVNYLFLILKHGYSGYGFFNQAGNFDEAQSVIKDELTNKSNISRDQLLSLIESNLSFVNASAINVGGKRFFRPLNYYCWDKLDFSREGERFSYLSIKGAFRLSNVNGQQPSDYLKLSLNAQGDPVYQLGVLAQSNPGKFTLELVGEDGAGYILSDNWTDRPFQGSNPFYSRSKQDGVTVITNGSLSGKAEEVQSFTEDARGLKNEPFIVLDLRGNRGGNSGVAEDWVTNLTGIHPAWPYTYTVLSTRTTLAGKITSYAANPNLPKQYTEEAQAELRGLLEGTAKRGWSELEVPDFSTIPNPGQLIVVLIDRGTGGADSFVGYLKQLNNVVIIGESTRGRGLFGDNTRYSLPNSGLSVILQYKIFAPTDFNDSSDTGVKPDLWVPAADALPRALAAIKKGWLLPGN